METSDVDRVRSLRLLKLPLLRCPVSFEPHLPQHATRHTKDSKRSAGQATHQTEKFCAAVASASRSYGSAKAWGRTFSSSPLDLVREHYRQVAGSLILGNASLRGTEEEAIVPTRWVVYLGSQHSSMLG